MFRLALVFGLCAVAATPALIATPVDAGTIERACRSSSRGASQAKLCNCIGQVAEQRLSRAEQRTVASWFQDPHRAQQVRQSASRKDTQLWQKYQIFGADAERICG